MRSPDVMSYIMRLGLEISQVKDIDILLERILTDARQITGADAGSIYVREGESLIFRNAQNETLRKQLPPGKKLIYSTFTVPVDSRSIAGHVALTGEVLNIRDVNSLDGTVPYTFNRSFDEKAGYRTVSMLALPLKTVHGEVTGVLQLINASKDGGIVPFPREEEPVLMQYANTAATAIERAALTRAMILRMNKMAELRDPKETGPHVNRVASFSVSLYESWAARKGIPQEEIDRTRDVLRMAAMLHDVGKVAISDTILKKPGRFTEDEFEVMKSHTLLGAQLFQERYSDFDDMAAEVALSHHERWDGKGYPGWVNIQDGTPLPGRTGEDGRPLGRVGEEIPLVGRVVAIADVYDALSSRRCYKDAWDEGSVLDTIREDAGKQFDPELVDLFLDNIEEFKAIRNRYPDED